MLIIPAIDLREGRCVRLTQGRRTEARIYDGDPVEIAKAYEMSGAQMLHVVDLDGAFADVNAVNRRVAKAIISELTIPVQFGGGLRTQNDIEQLIDAGAHRVVLGTLAAESPEKLEQLEEQFGTKICVGIDARRGMVLTHGWEKDGGLLATELALQVARAGIQRIVYTDVARDGMMTGVNVDQTSAIARASGLWVTASGGVSSLDDIAKLKAVEECGVDSVIVGKALYERRFTLEEALNIA